jgi:hypothetical protein
MYDMVRGGTGYLLIFMMQLTIMLRVAGYKLTVVFHVVGHCLRMGALSRLFSVLRYFTYL